MSIIGGAIIGGGPGGGLCLLPPFSASTTTAAVGVALFSPTNPHANPTMSTKSELRLTTPMPRPDPREKRGV